MKKIELLWEVDNFSNKYFSDKKYFTCVYWSYANWMYDEESDLDIFFSSNNFKEWDFENTASFLRDLHIEQWLKLDDEVPYKNKILVSYKDIKNAVNLKWLDFKDWKIIVPKIEKTEEFLSSYKVRLRLIFNALTSPNYISWNDLKSYNTYKNEAENNLFLLSLDLSNKLRVTIPDLVDSLMVSKDKEKGEMFLWYKEYDSIRNYLEWILSKISSIVLSKWSYKSSIIHKEILV